MDCQNSQFNLHVNPWTLRLLLALLLVVAVSGCSSRPQIPVPISYALSSTNDTTLGRHVEREAAPHGNLSGFRLLSEGLDAFASRLLLMETAEASLDVQTYLYHDDVTSKLFTLFLIRAADRGVRVRLLIDDFGHGGQEPMLAALASHPNISVRLFNPFSSRTVPYLDFVTNFSMKSRRMHNKTFTVDNQAAIIGGRNIGDTYFAADAFTGFADLDVLGFGPFARKISNSFDSYWNHSLSVPVEHLWQKDDGKTLDQLREELALASTNDRSVAYLDRLKSIPLLDELRRGDLALDWATAEVVYDRPDKLLTDTDDDSTHMVPELRHLLGVTQSEALIISPYFVPGDQLVQTFADWAAQGAEVLILTNSLAANDVAAAHAGYSAYREALLGSGVELWELKPRPAPGRDNSGTLFGSSRASLHAKTMVFDRQRIFVGSMNLDPRSANLNTEIGAVINSEPMSTEAAERFRQALPFYAWRLKLVEQEGWLGDSHRILWLDTSQSPPHIVSEDREPEAGLWRRFQAWFIGLMPVESLL